MERAQLDKVNQLSSHIEANPSHAFIEYHWGDFKYDPINVLYQYFDAFLYWANWGSPQLAFRFPHGLLPDDLLNEYDCDDMVTLLAELLQLPEELLLAASQHSIGTMPPTRQDDFDTWVTFLPEERKNEYLLRLAQNEPGLSHQFVRDLRELHRDKNSVRRSTGERVTYATLNSECKTIKDRREREKREREREERLRHLQYVHDHEEQYWFRINQAVSTITIV